MVKLALDSKAYEADQHSIGVEVVSTIGIAGQGT